MTHIAVQALTACPFFVFSVPCAKGTWKSDICIERVKRAAGSRSVARFVDAGARPDRVGDARQVFNGRERDTGPLSVFGGGIGRLSQSVSGHVSLKEVLLRTCTINIISFIIVTRCSTRRSIMCCRCPVIRWC